MIVVDTRKPLARIGVSGETKTTNGRRTMTVNEAHNTEAGTSVLYGKNRLVVTFVKTSRSNTRATYITARKASGETVEAKCKHFRKV